MVIPDLDELAAFIDRLLDVKQPADDPAGILVPSTRPIERLGLLLDPITDLTDWIESHRPDAIFLHRPWGLFSERLPQGLGVLAYHHAFDTHMSIGYNPHLARSIGLSIVGSLGRQEGGILGMQGVIEAQSWDTFLAHVQSIFQGSESTIPPSSGVVRGVAVARAMNEQLIRHAAACGMDLYLTGQMRPSARKTVRETGIGVIATGHARAEHWGLRQLGKLLQQQFPALQIIVHPMDQRKP